MNVHAHACVFHVLSCSLPSKARPGWRLLAALDRETHTESEGPAGPQGRLPGRPLGSPAWYLRLGGAGLTVQPTGYSRNTRV